MKYFICYTIAYFICYSISALAIAFGTYQAYRRYEDEVEADIKNGITGLAMNLVSSVQVSITNYLQDVLPNTI